MSANTMPSATDVDVEDADGDAMPSANVVGGNSDVVGTWHGVPRACNVCTTGNDFLDAANGDALAFDFCLYPLASFGF